MQMFIWLDCLVQAKTKMTSSYAFCIIGTGYQSVQGGIFYFYFDWSDHTMRPYWVSMWDTTRFSLIGHTLPQVRFEEARPSHQDALRLVPAPGVSRR